MSTYDDSAKALAEVATAARRGDESAVVAEVIGQGTSLLSGAPGVGALIKGLFEQVAQITAYGRMETAVKALRADATEAERARKIAETIVAMLRETVRGAKGIDNDAALDGLQAQVAELNAAIDRLAAQSGGVVHHNQVGSVSGGSVGILHGSATFNNDGRK